MVAYINPILIRPIFTCSNTLTMNGTGDPWLSNPWITSPTFTTTQVSTLPSSIIWYNIPMGFNTTGNDIWLNQQNLLVMQTQQWSPVAPAVLRRPRQIETERRYIEAEELTRERAQRIATEREAAQAKARELLLQHLTPEQAAQMRRDNFFVVQGGKSGKQYRINVNRGVAGNIEEICEKSKAIIARLCCHCSHDIPQDDQFLTQKLMLELDEEAFLKVANRR